MVDFGGKDAEEEPTVRCRFKIYLLLINIRHIYFKYNFLIFFSYIQRVKLLATFIPVFSNLFSSYALIKGWNLECYIQVP